MRFPALMGILLIIICYTLSCTTSFQFNLIFLLCQSDNKTFDPPSPSEYFLDAGFFGDLPTRLMRRKESYFVLLSLLIEQLCCIYVVNLHVADKTAKCGCFK